MFCEKVWNLRRKRIESRSLKEFTILCEKVDRQMHPLKNVQLLQHRGKLHMT